MRVETPYPPDLDLLAGHERRTDNHCWRPAGTPVAMLIHTISGTAAVRVEDAEVPVGGGDTVLWAAGAPQEFRCERGREPWEIAWVHFRPRSHWQGWLSWSPLGAGVSWVPSPQAGIRAHIEESLLEAVGAANSATYQARGFALNALERAVLWLDAANPGPRLLDDRIQAAVLFIARHLDQPLELRAIAASVRLSPSRLSHLFKEQLGVSPARFVEQRRIERAQGLLESSSLSIAAVAQATGFSSQFYFANRFRAHVGASPTEWRRRRHTRVGPGQG